MDKNFEPIYSILTSKPVNLESMQIYDMQALIVKQDSQIRALSEYILNHSVLTFEVNADSENITVGGIEIAKVRRISGAVVEVAMNRKVFQADAVYTENNVPAREIAISANVLTITFGGFVRNFTLSII